MRHIETRRDEVREVLHGVEVPDPYRWLEDPNSADTRNWLAAQTQDTASYFESTNRERIRTRLAKLMQTDEMTIPHEREGYFYFSRRQSGQQRFSICRRAVISGEEEILVDPADTSSDGTVGIELRDVTPDGKLLAFFLRRGGEDETEIRVLEVSSRRTVDTVPRAKHALPSWKHDGSGFYYSSWEQDRGHIRFHRLGTPIGQDREILTAGTGEWVGANVSDDGRYLLIHVWPGSAGDRTKLYLQVLEPQGPLMTVVDDLDAHSGMTMAGDVLLITTNWNAPNYRVLRTDLSHLSREFWRDIVSERSDCIEMVTAVGGKLVINYLHNAVSKLCMFDIDGAEIKELPLPGAGSVVGVEGASRASGIHGRWDSDDAFFFFQSFDRSPALYHQNLKSGLQESWSGRVAPVDPKQFEIRQVWYSSRDGTRVPMFLFHRRDLHLDGARPTMLYGYGGFKFSTTPFFFPPAVIWAEAGGVFASANLRGGGEFGLSWHEAGRREKKQNVFDDFIAAAEWLIDNKYTQPSKLSILGGSNGGLLVGAAMTQRPGLFGAVLCVRPLLDMIRYHKFSIASLWVPEYGSAEQADEFAWLLKYSPYHNVRERVRYPATLFVTSDFDTRVDPMHARKMTATLQMATSSEAPILLRYGTEAGHSGAAALDTIIDELTDELAFLSKELGAEL